MRGLSRWLGASTLALVLACLTQIACSTAGASAAHSFDKQAFDTLLVAQAAIEQAKVEGKDASPSIVHAINAAIAHYNQTYDVYVAFHNSVEIGTNTNSDNLKQQLIALLGEIGQIRQMMSHTGKPEALLRSLDRGRERGRISFEEART